MTKNSKIPLYNNLNNFPRKTLTEEEGESYLQAASRPQAEPEPGFVGNPLAGFSKNLRFSVPVAEGPARDQILTFDGAPQGFHHAVADHEASLRIERPP